MTEKEKMIAGLCYNSLDEELTKDRHRAHDLCHELSMIRPSDRKTKNSILSQLLHMDCEKIYINPPFFCDYGYNITPGENFFCNFGCVILDCAPVSIGKNVFLGPNVQIYTPLHPLDPDERLTDEYASPVKIGDNIWIGGGAIVCPGVNIGSNSVIGAGSVVTRDIPEWVLAVGNPCKPIKKLK